MTIPFQIIGDDSILALVNKSKGMPLTTTGSKEVGLFVQSRVVSVLKFSEF